MTHHRAVAWMVLATFLWATAGVVTRHLDAARSFEVTFWRSCFTALALLFILPSLRGWRVFANMRHAGWSFWLSGLCWGVMFTTFMLAMTLTSVANVLITLALGPLFTALIARIFIGHRIATRTWFAIAVAGAGIVYMYGAQLGGGQWLGSLIALCVPLASACNWTIVQNSHTQGHDVDLVPAVLVGATISSLATLPLAFPFQATGHDVGLLAFLGVFQLAVPCVLSVLCARVLKAPELSLLALLEVVFGILLAWAGAGEVPESTVLIGGAVVIGALVYTVKKTDV
ncbi:MAG: hypothetical protein RIR79_49 [Pseudomonadota bacterium]